MNMTVLDQRIRAAYQSRREWLESRIGLWPDGWIGDRVDEAVPAKVDPYTGRHCNGPDSLRQRVIRASRLLGPDVSSADVAREAGASHEVRRVACCLAHLRKQGLLPYSGRRRPRVAS